MSNKTAPLLALDIGTRTVVGLVVSSHNKGIKIRSAAIEEHEERAMYQGQIHDVEMVAATVGRVKKVLEKRLGQKLQRTAVAAAGRSLLTLEGQAQAALPAAQSLSRERVQALQLEAVQQACRALEKDGETGRASSRFMCVGFNPVRFYLDGQPITSLVGQKGETAGVTVIATFLPRVVVDSLLAVLDQSGLQLESMTLEPIAALEVALDPGMRGLNLALVDVGAGTSDIALSQSGTICGFGMVPLAGDHMTEALSQNLVLDFHAAERLKKEAQQGHDPLELTDALGNHRCLAADQVLELLQTSVQELAQQIAGTIMDLNRKAPDGVLLIGGGSLSPGLPQALAHALDLSPERVGIRSRDSLKGIWGQDQRLQGPEAVTPLGIARWSICNPPLSYLRVTVNSHPVYLWNVQGTTVADALLAAGSGRRNLFPRPGDAVTAERDGEVVVIAGKPGQPCQVQINGEEAHLEAQVKDGDSLEMHPPRDGEPARPRILELLKQRVFSVSVNGETISLPVRVWLNGDEVSDFSQPVPDRSRLETRTEQTLAVALAQAGLPPHPETQLLHVRVNGEAQTVEQPRLTYLVNGQAAPPDTRLTPGDQVTCSEAVEPPRLGSLLPANLPRLTVTVNEQPLHLPCPVRLYVNGQPAHPDTPLLDRAEVEYTVQKEASLQDLLLLNDPREYKNGRRLRMTVNGQEAQFTSVLRDGDRVVFMWE